MFAADSVQLFAAATWPNDDYAVAPLATVATVRPGGVDEKLAPRVGALEPNHRCRIRCHRVDDAKVLGLSDLSVDIAGRMCSGI